MGVTEENMTPTAMLEKITELDYAHSQQRDLNAKMRQWLDVADDDIAMLRSENGNLRKQVKALEKNISEAQQVEAEPCSSLLADDLNAKRCSEQKIQKLEKEYTTIKEQNKKLITELKILQEERDQDKNGLSRFKVSLQTLECSMGEAQLGLLKRDEVIHQKNLQLKHLEEAIEECSNIIKDLRLTNQKLSEQLENRLDEASFAFVNDLMAEKEGSLSPPMSFAEEMNLLASSAEVETNMSDSTDLRHEEFGAEELQKPQGLGDRVRPQSAPVDLLTKRCAGVLETAFQRARLFLLFVILTVSAFVASRSCTGNVFSINTLWSGARLMLQPYCSVQYGALPPI